MKTNFYYFLGLCFMTIFFSCADNVQKGPDVSDIDGSFKLVEFQKLLVSASSDAMADSISVWKTKYPAFFNLYINNILRIPAQNLTDEQLAQTLNDFVAFEGIEKIDSSINSVYNDFGPIKKEFEQTFQYMKYYIPEFSAPDIYTCNTEFGYQRFLFEAEGNDGLGIGLDLFLGGDFPYSSVTTNSSSFAKYLTKSYDEDHLVKKSVDAILEEKMPFPTGGNMLDQMLYYGKKLYILDHVLPFKSDTVIMEYSPEQLAWCEDNQIEMWAYFLKSDLFYSKDINKISKLISPSPSTMGMPPESPGRTANYLGWKIIEAYMVKYPETTFQELINLSDSQKILENSRFKPKRR